MEKSEAARNDGRRISHFQTFLDGKPFGGSVTGTGISIQWQQGPLVAGVQANGEPIYNPQNGAFVEDIIQIAVERLEFYQASPFYCSENKSAIVYLKDALSCLQRRTERRIEEGTEGTWQV